VSDRFQAKVSLSSLVAPAKVELCSCVLKANKVNGFSTALLDPCFRRGDGKGRLIPLRNGLTRRQFLALLGAACGASLPSRALAFGDSARWVPAMAQHAGRWDARRSALRRLSYEVQRRTATEVVLEPVPVQLDAPSLFEFPFLYFGGQGAFAPLKQAARENLKRYLQFGGFILADANEGSLPEGGLSEGGFEGSFKREMSFVLPQAPMALLEAEHVLFKSFYMLHAAAGRTGVGASLEACLLGRRAAVVLMPHDLLGVFARDGTGRFEFPVMPGGERQREMAMRLAINLVTYALCLDYKDDAAHLPALMRRRR